MQLILTDDDIFYNLTIQFVKILKYCDSPDPLSSFFTLYFCHSLWLDLMFELVLAKSQTGFAFSESFHMHTTHLSLSLLFLCLSGMADWDPRIRPTRCSAHAAWKQGKALKFFHSGNSFLHVLQYRTFLEITWVSCQLTCTKPIWQGYDSGTDNCPLDTQWVGMWKYFKHMCYMFERTALGNNLTWFVLKGTQSDTHRSPIIFIHTHYCGT